jgi:hypothetical protein
MEKRNVGQKKKAGNAQRDSRKSYNWSDSPEVDEFCRLIARIIVRVAASEEENIAA